MLDCTSVFFMLFFAREKNIPFYEERGKIGIFNVCFFFSEEGVSLYIPLNV